MHLEEDIPLLEHSSKFFMEKIELDFFIIIRSSIVRKHKNNHYS